jgi:hypothetical protein
MAYSDDIAFILSECARHAKMERHELRALPFADAFASLPHPSKRGAMICGAAAYQRLRDMAELALSRSVYAGRIDREAVVQNLKEVIVQRFLREKRELNGAQAEKAAHWAVKSAGKAVSDSTHLLPCHLGHAETPEKFSIGPVVFQKCKTVLTRLEPAFGVYVNNGLDERDREHAAWLLNETQQYYGSFDWIAEVHIEGCDRPTSERRGARMVQSALDCLHLLVGAAHSDHMRAGGPSFGMDRRGKIELSADGKIWISTSVDWLSHHFKAGWWDAINSNGGDEFVELMGLAIETGHDLPHPAPMAQRFLDAAAWYGEAVRDPFSASRLVKYVTAIERILSTKNEDKLADTLAARGSAIVMAIEEEDRETLRQRFKDVYDLRSRLVHGARSPLDAGLGHGLYEAERLTRSVLFSSLLFFRDEGLRAKEVSINRMEDAFGRLMDWAERETANRAALSTVR